VFRKQAACKHIVPQTTDWQADCTTISCHFRDCKELLVTSLTHVSGAIASVQTFNFTFTFTFFLWPIWIFILVDIMVQTRLYLLISFLYISAKLLLGSSNRGTSVMWYGGRIKPHCEWAVRLTNTRTRVSLINTRYRRPTNVSVMRHHDSRAIGLLMNGSVWRGHTTARRVKRQHAGRRPRSQSTCTSCHLTRRLTSQSWHKRGVRVELPEI